MTVFSGGKSFKCGRLAEASPRKRFTIGSTRRPPARRVSLDMVQEPIRPDARRHTRRKARHPPINRILQPDILMTIHNQFLTDTKGLDLKA